MNKFAKNCTSTVIPGMRHRDALKIIEWLGRAFGFEKHAVYMAAETTVGHTQRTFGNGMVMLGSANNASKTAGIPAQPDEIGGRETLTRKSSHQGKMIGLFDCVFPAWFVAAASS